MVRLVQPPLSAHGRLSGAVIQALAIDDVGVLHAWLQDAATHVEDTSDDANKRQTAVMWCARNGSGRCLRVLLEVGAETNAAMLDVGATALYLATQNGHEQCARLLVNAGANPNIARNTGTTPLAVAAKQNHFQIVYLLIQAGAKLDAATVAGATPLLVAAKAGSAESLTQLIRAGANVRCRASDGLTPLIAAAMSGCRKCIAALLDADVDVNARLPEGATAIFTLARRGDADSLSATAEAGADVNVRCRDGSTALIVAAQQGHAMCLQVLLRAGADVDAALNIGATALYVASQEGFCACVQVLLESGAKPNKARTTGGTALYAAGQQGHHGCVEKLLQAGAHATSVQDAGLCMSALATCVHHGHEHCARLLIEGGANVHTLARDGTTALFLAAEKGLETTVRRLLAAHASPHVMRVDGTSALEAAGALGHQGCQQMLKEASAGHTNTSQAKPTARLSEDVMVAVAQDEAAELAVLLRDGKSCGVNDFEPSKRQTALILAARHGSGKSMQVIIDAGADLEQSMVMRATALYIATQQGYKGCMHLLLNAGANPNVSREGGISPLYIAAQKGREDCVELLLASGANVNSAKQDLTTVLHCVTQAGLTSGLRQLLQAGAHADIVARDGTSALHIAALAEDVSCLQVLVDAGATCNVVTAQGISPLYVAAKAGNSEALRVLLGARANPNIARRNGSTPLMAAVHNGSTECTELLLDEGAVDPNITTREGVSALLVATQCKNYGCMQALLDRGAKAEFSDLRIGSVHIPLLTATESEDEQAVGILVRAGCNVNAANLRGLTALAVAVRRGNGTLVKLFLGAGADVNTCNSETGTPLIVAAQEGRADLLMMLLAAGSTDVVYNPSPDSPLGGRTALDFALQGGGDKKQQHSMVQLLRDAGAVAPSTEPVSLVGKSIRVGEREGKVISVEDKATFGMPVADRNVKFTVEFSARADGADTATVSKESVKLLRSVGPANNCGEVYEILGQLSVSGLSLPATADKAGAAPSDQDVSAYLGAAPETPATTSSSHDNATGDSQVGGDSLPAKPLAASGDAADNHALRKFREQLEAFYRVHNPDMLRDEPQMDKVVRYYATRQDELNGALTRQYGYDLQSPLPSAIDTNRTACDREKESQAVAQAIASNHASALINLLQNGAELPPDVRADATVLLEKAEEVELRAKQAQVDEWEQRRELAARKAADEAAAVETARTAAADADMNMVASARLATAAKLVVPDVSAANARVSEGQARVAKLAGQLSEEQGAVQSLREQIEELQRRLADRETTVERINQECDNANAELEEAKAFALDAEVKQDHAKRETAQHDKKCEQASAAKTRLENAEVLLVATESSLVEVQKGLKESIAAQDVAQVALQRMQGCMQRLGKDLDPAAVVGLLLEMPMCYAVQRAGLGLLLGVAKVPEHANTINAHNGQQALLFNIFRQLLGEEIEQLRELLAATRLGAIAKASEAMDTAISITSALAMVAVLCDEDIANEPLLQLRGMRALLTLFEEHQTAVQQLEDEPDERQRLRLRVERVQRDCPLALELCAAATRVAEFMDAFDKLNAAQDIAAVVAALSSVSAPPLTLVDFAAKKCMDDIGMIRSASAAEPLASLTALLTRQSIPKVNTPRHRLCGLLEIAEWIARADTEAGGKHRWLVEHFDTMIEHGVTSIAQAKQLIEDYGDLREWKIPKVAAKALFTSLEALLLELL